MKRQAMLRLLVKASTETNVSEFSKLQIELTAGIDGYAEYYDRKIDEDTDAKYETIETIVDHLLVETARCAPHLLPSMLPVFYMLCGDRDSKHWLGDPFSSED